MPRKMSDSIVPVVIFTVAVAVVIVIALKANTIQTEAQRQESERERNQFNYDDLGKENEEESDQKEEGDEDEKEREESEYSVTPLHSNDGGVIGKPKPSDVSRSESMVMSVSRMDIVLPSDDDSHADGRDLDGEISLSEYEAPDSANDSSQKMQPPPPIPGITEERKEEDPLMKDRIGGVISPQMSTGDLFMGEEDDLDLGDDVKPPGSGTTSQRSSFVNPTATLDSKEVGVLGIIDSDDETTEPQSGPIENGEYQDKILSTMTITPDASIGSDSPVESKEDASGGAAGSSSSSSSGDASSTVDPSPMSPETPAVDVVEVSEEDALVVTSPPSHIYDECSVYTHREYYEKYIRLDTERWADEQAGQVVMKTEESRSKYELKIKSLIDQLNDVIINSSPTTRVLKTIDFLLGIPTYQRLSLADKFRFSPGSSGLESSERNLIPLLKWLFGENHDVSETSVRSFQKILCMNAGKSDALYLYESMFVTNNTQRIIDVLFTRCNYELSVIIEEYENLSETKDTLYNDVMNYFQSAYDRESVVSEIDSAFYGLKKSLDNVLKLRKVESEETSVESARVAVDIIEAACLRKEYNRTREVCDIFTINSDAQINLIMQQFEERNKKSCRGLLLENEKLDFNPFSRNVWVMRMDLANNRMDWHKDRMLDSYDRLGTDVERLLFEVITRYHVNLQVVLSLIPKDKFKSDLQSELSLVGTPEYRVIELLSQISDDPPSVSASSSKPKSTTKDTTVTAIGDDIVDVAAELQEMEEKEEVEETTLSGLAASAEISESKTSSSVSDSSVSGGGAGAGGSDSLVITKTDERKHSPDADIMSEKKEEEEEFDLTGLLNVAPSFRGLSEDEFNIVSLAGKWKDHMDGAPKKKLRNSILLLSQLNWSQRRELFTKNAGLLGQFKRMVREENPNSVLNELIQGLLLVTNSTSYACYCIHHTLKEENNLHILLQILLSMTNFELKEVQQNYKFEYKVELIEELQSHDKCKRKNKGFLEILIDILECHRFEEPMTGEINPVRIEQLSYLKEMLDLSDREACQVYLNEQLNHKIKRRDRGGSDDLDADGIDDNFVPNGIKILSRLSWNELFVLQTRFDLLGMDLFKRKKSVLPKYEVELFEWTLRIACEPGAYYSDMLDFYLNTTFGFSAKETDACRVIRLRCERDLADVLGHFRENHLASQDKTFTELIERKCDEGGVFVQALVHWTGVPVSDLPKSKGFSIF